MQTIKLPLHHHYKDTFAIIQTLTGTYVCPGWHAVPEGTTREQIVFDGALEPVLPADFKPKAEPVVAQPKAWTVAGSKPGVEYNVLFNGKTWTCSCPASTFQRGPCKHVKAKQQELHTV